MVCNSNISFYVMQFGYSRIIKFDKDWNLIKYSSISNYFMITLVDNNVKRLFISRYNGLTEIDENLNLIKSVTVPGNNYGLYFNSTSVQLLVASGSYEIINVFDLNLTLIGNITVPYTNNYILEYNGLLYVSSQLSYIMVLENQIFNHSFSTYCYYIRNFAIDQNGILAISCSYNNIIYLYTSNGTYTGQSWQSPVYYPNSINFDSNGNLVISNYYGLYIFKSDPFIQTIENSSTFTSCDFCFNKSEVVLFYLTQAINLFFFKDLNLSNSLPNYQVQKSITYGDSNFLYLYSFHTICDGTTSSNYVLNSYYNSKISQFDSNWNFLNYRYVYHPNFMLGINDSSTLKIFVSTLYGIYSFDRNLNFLKLYSNSSTNYKRMYYNSSADHLLVCCNNCQRIDVFDHSLTFIKSISTNTYFPIDIDAYNDLMFVSTSSKTILVYQNETYLSNITTICSSIKASIIDQTGNIAVLCSSNVIYMYSNNGSYLRVNWTSLVPDLVDLLFDSKGNLALVASNGVVLLNNQTRRTNNSGVSLDSSCIINS